MRNLKNYIIESNKSCIYIAEQYIDCRGGCIRTGKGVDIIFTKGILNYVTIGRYETYHVFDYSHNYPFTPKYKIYYPTFVLNIGLNYQYLGFKSHEYGIKKY